ncbi:MAG: glycosyltransferase family 4 protein [Alphaproteobacteria bacterium]|nr:glycosyltransferase family 4 protein [Alphaproteobacteria bacterium]
MNLDPANRRSFRSSPDVDAQDRKPRPAAPYERCPLIDRSLIVHMSPELEQTPSRDLHNTIRVFVQLAHGFGAARWGWKWKRDEIIGLNERLPYGFFWAEEHGCLVEYSEDRPEHAFAAVFRLGVRLMLGFDLVHAWNNRAGILAAQVVWTGTESQYLAVLLLLRCLRPRDRPRVVAQTVWLFDSWSQLSRLKRWLYATLIADAAVLTVHSPEGLRVAQRLFPRQRSTFMPYGIAADRMALPRRRAHRPIRVLSAGSDRHRDWVTLVTALRNWPEAELRIVARQFPSGLPLGANISLIHPKSNEDYIALYSWADVVALALHPNLHGSGITIIEEATVLGVPVVATDAGGLRGYFSEEEITYVDVADADSMRRAILGIAHDEANLQMVERAQRRMVDSGLTSHQFARRHAELSRHLLYGSCVSADKEARQLEHGARGQAVAGE